MLEFEADFAIFSILAGPSNFWAKEYEKYGALELWEKLRNFKYSKNRQMEEIDARIKSFDLVRELALAEAKKVGFISRSSENWPARLKDCEPEPIGLQYKGAVDVLSKLKESIAIVGTRNPTRYGERIASDFAANFADHGWLVISGGALGVDAAAHRGALVAEGETIAVLAGGLDRIYPSVHENLFLRIGESGLLLSEVPLGVAAHPARFLIRNRLIASLASGTLVVEAANRSGSIRTALDAAKYHRPVFATPGPITSPASEGCHRLIIERVAELVTAPNEIRELLQSPDGFLPPESS